MRKKKVFSEGVCNIFIYLIWFQHSPNVNLSIMRFLINKVICVAISLLQLQNVSIGVTQHPRPISMIPLFNNLNFQMKHC